jgi:Reverse transcriptase (RNA-dependent DNA polymerase)
MIKTLHNESKIILSINQSLSDHIPVTGGVRQGCPIAPLLFAINTEPLRALSTSGTLHKRIQVLGTREAIGMYTDDTTGYIANNEDFLKFLETVKWYTTASGAQLNIEKIAVIFLGKPFNAQQLQVIEKGSADRLLGILIGSETGKTMVHNTKITKSRTNVAGGRPHTSH